MPAWLWLLSTSTSARPHLRSSHWPANFVNKRCWALTRRNQGATQGTSQIHAHAEGRMQDWRITTSEWRISYHVDLRPARVSTIIRKC
jgi:hypothetical protein